MIPYDIVNPSRVPRAMEYPHSPRPDVANWTEYHYFFGYDSDQDIGVSFHIGRLVEDLSVWRTILFVFLPQGEVLVRKFAGRSRTPMSVEAGPLRVTCIEPFQLWSVEFDGAMQLVDRRDLCSGPLADGVDEMVRFVMVLEVAAPFYSLDPASVEGLPKVGWGHDHFEQIHRIRGELTFRGETRLFEGMGNRDHSSGPRDTGKPYGGVFVNMLFPSGKAISYTYVKTATYDGAFGYVYWGDGTPLEPIKVLRSVPVNDASTPDGSVDPDILDGERTGIIVIDTSRGEQRIEVERRHAVASTYVAPHHEIAGTDYSHADAAQQTKAAAICRCGGEEGVAQLDRYVRIKTLRR